MDKYIIIPSFGCPIDKACGHDKWTMHCSYNERAVYYCDNGEPVGVPIMFLRQYGEGAAAEELVGDANASANK